MSRSRDGLAEAVYKRLNSQSKKTARELIDACLDLIKEQLERGEAVKLPNFGNFSVKSKRSRIGRNIRTGEVVEVSARNVVTFKQSFALRNRVNNGKGRVVPDITSQHIAITGTLESLTRDDAIKHIKNTGASFSNTITKKTTILVVGKNSGQYKVNKAAKDKIKAINEDEFLQLVGVPNTGRLSGF
jgi:integration host factor subunit alpha